MPAICELRTDSLASDVLESRRIPDPYYFEITNDSRILYPPTQRDIETYIDTSNPVFEKESQAFKKIKEAIREKRADLFVWITPPHPDHYPVLKIVISKIVKNKGKRVLFNRALVSNTIDRNRILDTANKLGILSENCPLFTDLENLRSCPIFLNIDLEEFVLQTLEPLDNVKRQIEIIRTNGDLAIKLQTKRQIRAILEQEEGLLRLNKLFGNFQRSCPTKNNLKITPFTLFFANAQSILTEKSFPCPKCEMPIPSGFGIETCPHCGAQKKDSGQNCD